MKLHFELAILDFWTKFTQEGYLWLKTERVKIIIEFCLHVFFFFNKYKFEKHKGQNAEILRNIARLTLTNITGKITFFKIVML